MEINKNITLKCGDCIELLKDIPNSSVELILVDIPYGEVNRESNGLRNLDKGKADIIDFDLEKSVTESIRISSGTIYMFCGFGQVSDIMNIMIENDLSVRLCIWEKNNPSPINGQYLWLSSIECCVYGKKPKATFNENCKSAVWRNPIEQGKLHPTMKPVSLMKRLILASSNVGDTVLDFTMGSGTTGVAAVLTNRKFIGFEKDLNYFEVAKNRIYNFQEEIEVGEEFQEFFE